MNKKNLFSVGILVFLLFVLFSYLTNKDLFTQFDFDNTVKLQDNISRRFDTPFSTLSLIGSFEISSLLLLILIVIRKKISGIFVFVPYIMAIFIELYGKIFVIHPGPPYLFFRNDIPFSFPSSYVQPGSSYPSGHSTRTLFISVVLIFMIGNSKRLSRFHKTV